MNKFLLLLLTGLVSIFGHAKPIAEFFEHTSQFNSQISTPESVLGFTLGERHARHDQLVTYFETLAKQSAKIKLTEIGYTYEHRKQILATISSAENLANLTDILAKRMQTPSQQISQPNVIWLGYSVHGDEISSAYAAMAVAYYLLASESSKVKQLLADTIIVMEPSINPDGMDRFTQWVNQFRGASMNTDPQHIEHNQSWFTGRTNHYSFDLNRDWLFQTQIESQHRMKFYQLYQPNVLADFHEMGANASYFFQPGVPDRTNPITPKKNQQLTRQLAEFHAKAFDQKQRLYFSEESYDDFYYGKGSTYPDINGAVGILFEQASSRGMAQQTENGVLTLTYGIENHVTTSLSTLFGAWQLRKELAQYRADFYQQSEQAAKKEAVKGYLIELDQDVSKFNQFMHILSANRIKVYALAKDFRYKGKIYAQHKSFFVPYQQAQYRVIKTLFEPVLTFNNKTFYDVSGWTLPLAMNIKTSPVERTWGLKTQKQAWQFSITNQAQPFAANAYAYVFSWQDSLAPKLLNQILNNGITAKVAMKDFRQSINGELKLFKAGSILIPAASQTQKNWRISLAKIVKKAGIPVYSLRSGDSKTGIDIGSRSFKVLKPLSVLLLVGKGISQYEVGEIRYYLDQQLNIPISLVNINRLSTANLNRYSHIIMVNSSYAGLGSKNQSKIKNWLQAGGVLFAQKQALNWLQKNDVLQAKLLRKSTINELFSTDKLQYSEKEQLSARKRIAGAIFTATIDTSHPLGFGFTDNKIALFKNSTDLMTSAKVPFSQVVKYTDSPLASGYTDNLLLNHVKNAPALVMHNVGKGKLVATGAVLAFRGFWAGSARLLSNALFFAQVADVPVAN